MTLAIDPVNFSLNIFYSDSQITYLHTLAKGTWRKGLERKKSL